MKKSYSVAEACEYLSIGKTYFYSLLNQNKIRARKLGKKRTIIFQEDLDNFLNTLEDYTTSPKGGENV